MRMIIYLPQNKHRFALLLVLVLAYCACLANTSVKSDVYRQLYGKSMMQAFAVYSLSRDGRDYVFLCSDPCPFCLSCVPTDSELYTLIF